MSIHKRRQAISSLLRQQGEVTIEELSERLDVSENTVRNDLIAMEADNALRRVRGGAVPIDDTPRVSSRVLAERSQTQRKEKRLMARWAASFINDGDTIMLDAGSTIYHLASFLTDHNNLTVLTNGIDVALLLAKNPSNKVMLASNVIRPDGLATIGDLHPSINKHFFAPKCFVSCSGVSIEQGLTDQDIDESAIKSQMMRLAEQVIVMVDHSKFGKIGTYSFATLDQVSYLVTDAAALESDYLDELQQVALFPIAVIGEDEAQTLEPLNSRTVRRYRIGFGNLTDRMPFAQQVRASLEDAARHLHNVELLLRDNDLDHQKALDNADWFVKSKVDLVIEYQLDDAAGNAIMDRFNQAQIPVIAVDIPMPGATFYGADNYRAGFIAGQNLGYWINKHWQGKFDVLLKLATTRVGAPVSARLQGMQEGLVSITGTTTPQHTIVVTDAVLLQEFEESVTRLLPQIPDDVRVAIIGLNDDASVGALNVFESAGRLNQVVAVGQGADDTGRAALRRSDFPFVGSTRYAPETYGEGLLHLAMKILRGEPVPPAVYQQHVFINRDNLDDYYGLQSP